jgi:hypothetical protein
LGTFWSIFSLFCALSNLPELLNVKGTNKCEKFHIFENFGFWGLFDKDVLFS